MKYPLLKTLLGQLMDDGKSDEQILATVRRLLGPLRAEHLAREERLRPYREQAARFRAERERLWAEHPPLEAGVYYARHSWKGTEAVQVTVGPRGGRLWSCGGMEGRVKRDKFNGRWQADGRDLHATEEEALAAPNVFERVAEAVLDPSLPSDPAGLRRLIAANHPDRNPGGDVRLFQRAVEKLDRIRNRPRSNP